MNANYVISMKNIPSSIVPVPHGPDLPVPTPPKRLLQAFPENTTSSDSVHGFGDPEYRMGIQNEERNPYYTSQKDLNDLVRYHVPTKSSGEILTSRLKQWDLIGKILIVISERKRHQRF